MHNAAVGSNEPFRQTMLEMHPVGRFGKPAEVASAVIWLCSEGACARSKNGHGLARLCVISLVPASLGGSKLVGRFLSFPRQMVSVSPSSL
jgi:hypothetical protein